MSEASGRRSPSATAYDPHAIETKWQARWREAGCFKASAASGARKFFNFDGGPFPNGPLHMGHVRTFTLGDVIARYRRMRGDAVLYCFEFDAFGLPNELAANAQGIVPEELTRRNIAQMRDQMVRLGLSYDWDHVTTTCDPDYYRWTQWLFLKLHERGLIYRRLAELNWCPGCQTTLAHMQVENGCCWRCETPVEQRRLTQWFVALSRYSAVLSDSLDGVEGFSARVRNVLHGLLGRTPGHEIDFVLEGRADVTLTAFVRADAVRTPPACLVIAPGHPVLEHILADTGVAERASSRQRRRTSDKSIPLDGFDTGLTALQPETGLRLPVFVAGHVEAAFATGIEIGFSHGNARDRQFAQRHDIVNDAAAALPRGRPAVHYRVHDWLVSRQRAWGTPIPIVHCGQCGEVAVPEHGLPVRLPALMPNMPPGGLATLADFATTECPRCGQAARRETDTLDCYFDVIWCFLACASGLKPGFSFKAADFAAWMPVDWFHNGLDSFFYMHLYRFLGRVLHEMGIVADPEPIRGYVGHDAVLLHGRKMSKHHGNVVSPDAIVARNGADVLRVQVLWSANPLRSVEWSEEGLRRASRLLSDIWELVAAYIRHVRATPEQSRRDGSGGRLPLDRSAARAIRRVSEFLNRYQPAGCLQEIQSFQRQLETELLRADAGDAARERSLARGIDALVIMLAPFAPHVAEELWEQLAGDGLVSMAPWPAAEAYEPRPAAPRHNVERRAAARSDEPARSRRS